MRCHDFPFQLPACQNTPCMRTIEEIVTLARFLIVGQASHPYNYNTVRYFNLMLAGHLFTIIIQPQVTAIDNMVFTACTLYLKYIHLYNTCIYYTHACSNNQDCSPVLNHHLLNGQQCLHTDLRVARLITKVFAPRSSTFLQCVCGGGGRGSI